MVIGTSNRANSWLEASCDLSGRKRVLAYSNREDSDSRRAAMRWAIVTVENRDSTMTYSRGSPLQADTREEKKII